jgi:hypothetical protein
MGPVVEAHHKFRLENNPARPASHGPHQIGTVRRNHEINHRRAASLGLELGFEDQGAGTVASLDAEQRILGCKKPPAVIGVSQQRGKASSRIEAGPAQPIDRAVAADQSRRLAVADERIVFDSKRHRSLFAP